MTNYDTIPTSTTPTTTTTTTTNFISRAKHHIQESLVTCRPWTFMFNLHSISPPHNFYDAVSRIRHNLSFFQTNYTILILLLVLFLNLSLLSHPISLLLLLSLIAVSLFLGDQSILICGYNANARVVHVLIGVVFVGLLLFSGVMADILVAVLIAAVVVVVHAALRRSDDLFLDEEQVASLTSTSST